MFSLYRFFLLSLNENISMFKSIWRKNAWKTGLIKQLKIPEDCWKLSKVFRKEWKQKQPAYPFSSPSLKTCIAKNDLSPSTWIRKYHHLHIAFIFLTLVLVYIFLEIASSKAATTHIFQSGEKIWPKRVRELTWDQRFQSAWWFRFTALLSSHAQLNSACWTEWFQILCYCCC